MTRTGVFAVIKKYYVYKKKNKKREIITDEYLSQVMILEKLHYLVTFKLRGFLKKKKSPVTTAGPLTLRTLSYFEIME